MAILINNPCLNLPASRIESTALGVVEQVSHNYCDRDLWTQIIGDNVLDGTLHDNGNVISLTMAYLMARTGFRVVSLVSDGNKENPSFHVEVTKINEIAHRFPAWFANQMVEAFEHKL